jgi:hypothetical protein
MANKYFKTGKFAYEMLVPTVKKNLKERRKHFEDVVKGTDKYTKSLTDEGKIAVKKNVSPTVSKISKIMDKKDAIGPGSSNPRAKRAGGGMMRSRMGLKGGSFPDLNKDGKTTFADVLIGRGVLPKGKKKKMMAKKSKSPMDKAIKKNKKRFV